MNPAAIYSPPRVAPKLAHAWGGIWRLTFRRFLLPGHWLTIAAGLVVLTLMFLGGVHGRDTDRFLGWAADFYVTVLVPALAFMAAAGAMRDELKSGTVDYVLTRPVPRPAFLAFKFLAHTICAQLDFLVAFGLVMLLAGSIHVPGLVPIAAKLLVGQVLMITAFSGLGFLCGTITSRYVVIGLAYAGVIEAGVGQIPTQVSKLSMTHQTRELLGILLGRLTPEATSPGLAGTAGLLLAFTVVTLAAAAAIFTWRELTGPADS